MNLSTDEQMRVLLGGNVYDWAVAQGLVNYGEPFLNSAIFTITQSDALSYFQDHPVPGVDVDVSIYQDRRDGLKWQQKNDKYLIGWQVREIFTPEGEATTQEEFRTMWIKAFIASLDLLP